MSYKIDESLGFILSNTQRKLSHFLLSKFKPYDITTEQWVLVAKLGEENGITQKDLAERTEKDQANVTRIIDLLEKKGLVRREKNSTDRRSMLVHLTDEGEKLREMLAPIEESVVNVSLSGMSEEEKALLKDFLARIAAAIQNECQDQD
ncbi:MarR family winged helix-turn-helix transcriptional regulator [Aneurinibacillus uraniidurans]|uniref:MarR family winged helix-turn-helix transcriptional regulator n=1 Tax=Aneurinibacillus uraniidurans TaxID=2966586 RepID=UPI00234A911C|nr:MarR family transcriptional regulator [Aneurinibacillus sp. B1]WCN39254.1 MarR family transcriptional regulator [Aneurinibacillus sp. B1]